MSSAILSKDKNQKHIFLDFILAHPCMCERQTSSPSESHSNLNILVNSTSHPLSVVRLCNQQERTTAEHKIPQNKPQKTGHKKGKVSHWLYFNQVSTQEENKQGDNPNIFWLSSVPSQIGMLKAFHSPKNCLSSVRKFFQAALDFYEEVLSDKCAILRHVAILLCSCGSCTLLPLVHKPSNWRQATAQICTL